MLTFSGRPIDDLLRTGRHQLVESILDDIARQVAMYAELPDLLGVDVRGVARDNLLLFEARVAGAAPDPEILARVTASAYRRAEEGFPLDLVQRAYLTGIATVWTTVAATAGPDDVTDLGALGDAALAHLTEVMLAVTGAYLEELRMSGDEAETVRTSLVAALLAGDEVDQVATSLGVSLPERYTVVALHIGGEPPEGGWSRPAAITARRRLRALRAELAGDRVNVPLFELDPYGGLVLLPHPHGDENAWDTAAVDALVRRLGGAAGAEVWAGTTTAGIAEVPAAAALAREIVDLVRRTSRSPGTYAMDDVLLDYQLSRPGPVADALRARLAPLATRPDLVATLHAHLATGQSRTRTAELVSVHPNTVDYRLRRVADLVGLDPWTADGLALLRAGLLGLDPAG
ncbi:PucR family transcriptional regulator [Nocardioides sp. LML1-1-1.1]|uniref:PucR family transcriptional regulator n=1 Tax=Nocardioides sp. LML1-1-1.1 TaxID=3135248 RepID=UPI00344961A6